MAEPAYDFTPEVKTIDYRPSKEFQDLVQDVIERRQNFKSNIGNMIPLSQAIDNECARRGIIR